MENNPITADDVRQQLREYADRAAANDDVTTFANAPCEVNDEGNVWDSRGYAGGHWWTDDELLAFGRWLRDYQ